MVLWAPFPGEVLGTVAPTLESLMMTWEAIAFTEASLWGPLSDPDIFPPTFWIVSTPENSEQLYP